jgi:hypothetical protein
MFGIVGRKFDQISYVSELIGAFFELLGDWMKKSTLCLGLVLSCGLHVSGNNDIRLLYLAV